MVACALMTPKPWKPSPCVDRSTSSCVDRRRNWGWLAARVACLCRLNHRHQVHSQSHNTPDPLNHERLTMIPD